MKRCLAFLLDAGCSANKGGDTLKKKVAKSLLNICLKMFLEEMLHVLRTPRGSVFWELR